MPMAHVEHLLLEVLSVTVTWDILESSAMKVSWFAFVSQEMLLAEDSVPIQIVVLDIRADIVLAIYR